MADLLKGNESNTKAKEKMNGCAYRIFPKCLTPMNTD
jgi:hypothetical protein